MQNWQHWLWTPNDGENVQNLFFLKKKTTGNEGRRQTPVESLINCTKFHDSRSKENLQREKEKKRKRLKQRKRLNICFSCCLKKDNTPNTKQIKITTPIYYVLFLVSET